jgi:hypothetical protein
VTTPFSNSASWFDDFPKWAEYAGYGFGVLYFVGLVALGIVEGRWGPLLYGVLGGVMGALLTAAGYYTGRITMKAEIEALDDKTAGQRASRDG